MKTEKSLITPATFPWGKIFPSPFPSFFIPASLNAQQLLGPALHVPAMITSLGYWEGGPREGEGILKFFGLACSGSLLVGCSLLTLS